MASYTNISGVKLITTGDEAGTWGASTNTNLEILDAASKGFKKITMVDADYTLPLDNNPSAVENGHYAGIEFFGANSAERTITLEQNDHTLVYTFLNNTGQNLVIKQGDGSGGTVTIADGFSAMVFCDGAGTGAKVTDVSSAAKAQALANSRNFSITGDITAAAVAFDGTGNVALSAGITADTIVDADINSSAAIADTKLATISTASKVSNSATTATDANTASAIVARDASGNFIAGTITASLTGNVTGNADTATTATTAGTVTTAAQPNITSLGTLTTLTVDNITVDGDVISATGDLYVRPTGDNVYLQGISSDEQVRIYLGASEQTISSSDALKISSNNTSTGNLTLNPATGFLKFEDASTSRGYLDLNTETEVKLYTQDSVGTATLNTTFDGANAIVAGNVSAGGQVIMTAGTEDWTVTADGTNLTFAYNGVNKMRLDSSGNLTVTGDITAYGTIS